MNQLKVVKNEKPRNLAGTKLQGKFGISGNGKDTTLDVAKARYERGMELYRQGKVNIAPDGLFIVNGYKVDPERVSCECPDYSKHKQPCKHFYAVSLWQKNRGKIRIENLSSAVIASVNSSGSPSKDTGPANNPSPYDRQRTITRLACINSAIEVLKANEEFIELDELLSVARQLEAWALGS